LLFIRLLVFTAIILLLADLYKSRTPATPEPLHALILIHPAAGDTSQYRKLAASWQNDTVKVHWLTAGFPPAIDPAKGADIHLWSLLAEADRRFPADSIHVIAPNRQSYFTGTPSYISATLSWELTEVPGDSVRLLWARQAGNEPELLWFRTNAEVSEHYLQKGLSDAGRQAVSYSADKRQVQVKQGRNTYQLPVSSPDTLSVAALVRDDRQEEWELFQKSVQALAQYHQVPVKFVAASEREIDWLVNWTTKAQLPENIQATLVFHYAPGRSEDWLEPADKSNLYIRKELVITQVLEGGFLEALRPYLMAFKYKEAAPPPADFRQIDLAGFHGGSESNRLAPVPEPEQEKKGNERIWLGLLALGMISLERIWPKKIS
jgi:hypothetical protein